jgi:hypothetical protein
MIQLHDWIRMRFCTAVEMRDLTEFALGSECHAVESRLPATLTSFKSTKCTLVLDNFGISMVTWSLGNSFGFG